MELTVERVWRNVPGARAERAILKDVSLHVREGSLIGLIGPNGAGKSTLLRVMAGLLPPSRGRVLLEGRPLHTLAAKERARSIAVVSQNPQMGFGFTVRDVVEMGRYPYRDRLSPLGAADADVVAQAMEVAGVSHLRERRITTLSGGERQRTFLARAIAQQPRILLLDEPTANLDIRYQLEILSLIQVLNRRERLTVVMAVHDLTLALHYCDALVALSEGRIAASGAPAEVMTPELIYEVFGVAARVASDPATGNPVRVDYWEPLGEVAR